MKTGCLFVFFIVISAAAFARDGVPSTLVSRVQFVNHVGAIPEALLYTSKDAAWFSVSLDTWVVVPTEGDPLTCIEWIGPWISFTDEDPAVADRGVNTDLSLDLRTFSRAHGEFLIHSKADSSIRFSTIQATSGCEAAGHYAFFLSLVQLF